MPGWAGPEAPFKKRLEIRRVRGDIIVVAPHGCRIRGCASNGFRTGSWEQLLSGVEDRNYLQPEPFVRNLHPNHGGAATS